MIDWNKTMQLPTTLQKAKEIYGNSWNANLSHTVNIFNSFQKKGVVIPGSADWSVLLYPTNHYYDLPLFSNNNEIYNLKDKNTTFGLIGVSGRYTILPSLAVKFISKKLGYEEPDFIFSINIKDIDILYDVVCFSIGVNGLAQKGKSAGFNKCFGCGSLYQETR